MERQWMNLCHLLTDVVDCCLKSPLIPERDSESWSDRTWSCCTTASFRQAPAVKDRKRNSLRSKYTWKHMVSQLHSGPSPPSTHHVVPKADGHLSVGSLTDVETVYGEETEVGLSLLAKRTDFQHEHVSLFVCGCLCWYVCLCNSLQFEG